MKIVTWNCNGAFRNKFEFINHIDADILIIQECEDPAHSKDIAYKSWASNYLWLGTNKNSGLGVFAKETISVKSLEWNSLGLESFIPFRINDNLTILAVWTRQANSPTFQYIGQLWKYLQAHQSKLPFSQAVICGDFNSNACWDKWDRWWNHSDVVSDLEKIGIHSIYHHIKQEAQGKESSPTFYTHRKIEKPYHIDYAFASKALLTSAQLEIGNPTEWLKLSDHMPIIFKVT
jgi:exonuclease III